MSTPMSLFDLIEVWQKEDGCPVCILTHRHVDQFFYSLLYERVTKPDAHEIFRAGKGLCNAHAWQVSKQQGGLLNIAVYYRLVVKDILAAMDSPAASSSGRGGLARFMGGGGADGSALADALEPTGPCFACQARVYSEKLHTQMIADYIHDDRLSDAYRASEGLCLPHFRQTLRKVRQPDNRRLLVEIQRGIWQALFDELAVFKDMHDYRHTGERMGEEGDSWLRVIRYMAGEPGIFGIDPTAE